MHPSTTAAPPGLNFFRWAQLFLFALTAFTLFTFASRTSIPLGSVPITLQVLAFCAVPLLFPRGTATLGALAWYASGIAGMPVFATPLGAFGPTGGYLLAMVISVCVLDTLTPTLTGPVQRLVAAFLATAFIFVLGLLWLNTFLPPSANLFAMGLYPFLGSSLIQAALAVLLTQAWQQAKPPS